MFSPNFDSFAPSDARAMLAAAPFGLIRVTEGEEDDDLPLTKAVRAKRL
jgi:hypothetical protein